jgi:hypothetical protein
LKSKLTDQEQVIRSIEAARFILVQHFEPGVSDANRSLDRLLSILDDEALVSAVGRLKGRQMMRLVE